MLNNNSQEPIKQIDFDTVMDIVYYNNPTDAIKILKQYANDDKYQECIETLKTEYESNIRGITFQEYFGDSYFCDGTYYEENSQDLISYAEFCKKCFKLMEKAIS